MFKSTTIKTETPKLKKALGRPNKYGFFARARAVRLLLYSKTISHVMLLNEATHQAKILDVYTPTKTYRDNDEYIKQYIKDHYKEYSDYKPLYIEEFRKKVS